MKLSIIGIALILITGNSYSQSNNRVSKATESISPMSGSASGNENSNKLIDTTLPDGIMLNGTKMVIVTNGEMKPMEKDIVFGNGTRVTKAGYVYRKHKPKLLLNFDEYVDTSGKLLPMNSSNSSIIHH